jgi:hypothetical protein
MAKRSARWHHLADGDFPLSAKVHVFGAHFFSKSEIRFGKEMGDRIIYAAARRKSRCTHNFCVCPGF